MDCHTCHKPVDETSPYVSYVRHVEVLHGDMITVLDADTIELRHLDCD